MNSNTYAHKQILIQRNFSCWCEADQKDTTLTVGCFYGREVSAQPLQVLSFEIFMPNGEPHIGAISALFRFVTKITATQSTKFLGYERKQTYDQSDLRLQMELLRQSFCKVKEIYKRWSETAKTEHVTNFRKVMTDKEIFDIPCIYRCYNHNEFYDYSSRFSQSDILKYEFIVDDMGNCKVFWGIINEEGEKPVIFSRKVTVANYGGLVQKSITKTMGLKTNKAGLWFTNPEQIQSLIDVLDYDSINKEGKENYNKKDSRDELFK